MDMDWLEMNDVQKAQTGAFLPGLAFSSAACFNGDKENERQLKCSCCGFGIQFMIFFDRYHLQPQFMFPPEQANVRIAKKTENRLQCLSHFTESPVWQVTASPSSLCLTCIFRCIWPWALQNKHLIWHDKWSSLTRLRVRVEKGNGRLTTYTFYISRNQLRP